MVATDPPLFDYEPAWKAARAGVALLQDLRIEEYALGGSFALVAMGYQLPGTRTRIDVDFACNRAPSIEEIKDAGFQLDAYAASDDLQDNNDDEHGTAINVDGVKVDFIPFGGKFSAATPTPDELRDILLADVHAVRGIPVMGVDAVLQWKRFAGRDKDIQFINDFSRQLMVRTVLAVQKED